MNQQQNEQFAAKIKSALDQAQPDLATRQRLAAARQAALRGESLKPHSSVLAWAKPHRSALMGTSLLLVLALAFYGINQSWQKPQYLATDLTVQVVDEVLYDSLEDF